jgi:hypothetical protein
MCLGSRQWFAMAHQPCAGAGEALPAGAHSASESEVPNTRHFLTAEVNAVTCSEIYHNRLARYSPPLPSTMTCVRIAARGCAFAGRLMRKPFAPDLKFLLFALARSPPLT